MGTVYSSSKADSDTSIQTECTLVLIFLTPICMRMHKKLIITTFRIYDLQETMYTVHNVRDHCNSLAFDICGKTCIYSSYIQFLPFKGS